MAPPDLPPRPPLAPSPCPGGRRKRSRALRLLFAAAALLFVAACGESVVVPPVETDRLDLVAQTPVAAAEVELRRPPGTTLVRVEPLRPGLLVSSASSGDRVRVAWIGTSAEAGPQVRFVWARPEGADDAPTMASARAYAGAASHDLGAGVLEWRDTQAAAVTNAPLTAAAVDHAAVTSPRLEASFADHPLGDLDGDGALGVRDALVLFEHLDGADWTDFARYHGDLDGDDVSDVADLRLLLDKVVDPSLPARLHVKPRSLTFAQLDPATMLDAVVLVANGGRQALDGLTWTPPSGVVASEVAGIAGQSAALSLTLPASSRRGWTPGFLRVAAAGDEAEVRLGHLVLLIAGQSNASGRGAPVTGWPEAPTPSVRMLANDYLWRDAVEPLDAAGGQIDPYPDVSASYSLGTRLGGLLVDATGFTTYLIPAAHGGTAITQWLPPTNRLDRSTLFGAANFRAQVSAALQPNPVVEQPFPSEGGPVTAIVWYQGESDESRSERAVFVDLTDRVMSAFEAELGVPVVYVQLASHCAEQRHVQQHAVGELQRRMESGSGYPEERAGRHMVVAFDLPRSDCIHLSAFGLRELAVRVDLAIREHVLGEVVDGTGPRLVRIDHAGTGITLRTDRDLAAGTFDARLFQVFDGDPGSVDDVENYGDNAIPISAVERDPGDARSVRITLARAPTATPWVAYMARANQDPCCATNVPSHPHLWEVVAAGTIRGAGSGLPLPTFGPLQPF
jgi:hypothetical protein